MKKGLFLIDTNICVFFLRNKYGIDAKFRQIGIDRCFISEITVAELLYGAECSRCPEENKSLVYEFCNCIQTLPIKDVIYEYARQKAILRRKGILIDDMDLLIGATAITHKMTLVSDTIKHFERLEEIALENWIER